MSNNPKVIYIAQTDTIGGCENGVARSSDGILDIRFSAPGSTGIGTNPEQLLAAGWSASLASSIATIAMLRGIILPGEVKIHAELSLTFDPEDFAVTARLNVALPGIERTAGDALLKEAIQICPVSRVMRLDCDVRLELA